MEALQQSLRQYCLEALQSTWGTEEFDRWLFLDAGTSFDYAFSTHICTIYPSQKDKSKRHGKLCVYEMQRYVRANKEYTLESLLACADAYIANLVGILGTSEPQQQPIKEDGYSYFI